MRLSIRYKLVSGLAIIFIISYGIAVIFWGNAIQSNNENIIEMDMKQHIYNLNLYIKQYMSSSEIDNTHNGFDENADTIGNVLSTKFDERIILYDRTGGFLYDSIQSDGRIYNGTESYNDDIQRAIENENSYTIINNNKEFKAAVSVPVIIDDMRIGIIRYVFDYGYLKTYSSNLFKSINISMLFIFFTVFIFSSLLSSRIIKPIRSLKKATTMITNGDFDCSLNIETGDELEALASDFNIMKSTIEDRIREVEVERDNLIRLHKHRKLFFDNVTHELKTPLTVISGYTQILQEYDEGMDKEFFDNTLQKIRRESIRMHSMIIELLEAAKVESEMEYNFVNINLSKILDEVVESISTKYVNKKMKLKIDIQNDVRYYGDPLRLNQVMTNILDNAYKYSDEDSIIEIGLYIEKDNIIFSVDDNGIGINEDGIEHIFKPFYKNQAGLRESNGLGLYIVKAIVERHGGKIVVESKYGIGTSIDIIFDL